MRDSMNSVGTSPDGMLVQPWYTLAILITRDIAPPASRDRGSHGLCGEALHLAYGFPPGMVRHGLSTRTRRHAEVVVESPSGVIARFDP